MGNNQSIDEETVKFINYANEKLEEISNYACSVSERLEKVISSVEQKDKNLEYYYNSNKIFWVVNKDINDKIKANDIVPCIYVCKKDDKYEILRFDPNINFNNYKYTSWRKFLGSLYNIYVDVFLIYNDSDEGLKLISLRGEEIDFNSLTMSDILISEEHLAKFDIIKNDQ